MYYYVRHKQSKLHYGAACKLVYSVQCTYYWYWLRGLKSTVVLCIWCVKYVHLYPKYFSTIAGFINFCFFCTFVFFTRHMLVWDGTSWNCASQSQVSHHGNIFAPLPSGFWSYRVTSSAPMADGLSVWLVRRSGIPYRTTCVTRLLAGTVSDNLWRRFCSQRTDEFSAL